MLLQNWALRSIEHADMLVARCAQSEKKEHSAFESSPLNRMQLTRSVHALVWHPVLTQTISGITASAQNWIL